MKRAFKWLAWGVAGLVGIVLFFGADKTTQWVLTVIGFALFAYATAERSAEERQKQVIYRLDAIRSHLENLRNHPLNTNFITEGIEGLVEEHRLRERARNSDPHRL